MAKRLITGIFTLIMGWSVPLAHAEALPDPTRPPLEAGLAEGVAVVPSGPVLQSVKIAPGRRMAVISGQLLAEGDKFGELKLIRIAEGDVVLSGPEGRQTLRLFPEVEKHMVLPPQGQPLKAQKNKPKRKTEQKAP
jgi:hypothetical protein